MTTILIAADAEWIRNQVSTAFISRDDRVIGVERGQDVRTAYAEHAPDLVILDLQIGNMGGIAAALDLRHEESAGRLDRAKILLLLDREVDRFLAQRVDVDGLLVKPIDAGQLRRAAQEILGTTTAVVRGIAR